MVNKMNKQEFLQALADIKKYWLNVPKETLCMTLADRAKSESELRMNGMIFSMLCLFDGSSGENDFVPITLVNGVNPQTGTIINAPFTELHAEWCEYE